MKDELLYSYWGADPVSREDLTKAIFESVGKFFPQPTSWTTGHNIYRGNEARMRILDEVELVKHGQSLSELWIWTKQHLAKHSIELNGLVCSSTAYNKDLELGIRVYQDDCNVSINSEPEMVKTMLIDNKTLMFDLLKEIGMNKSIFSVWTRRHAAFAGDPVGLYEPGTVFKNLYNPLKYSQAIEEVQKIRESVKSKLGFEKITEILNELGINPKRIANDRLFVELGNPMKEGGKNVLKELEKLIKIQLKRN